ncbi:uncharacterized protein LOC113995619 isoform X4 [Pipra filicauda]|uniref:Uncharacterized protein LOC113995619 isoform X4 n=1 Tax=Pipra filicauda TaxID=649802 RepID=A0A7R5KGF2_9PASS|nr:uncharacterized protein LOC113995619 isoform X4 [Pipra filicauda]
MSTNRRKRRGGAINSRQASKRSRLLASSAGEASAAEPIDLEESRVLSFDLAVDEIIDLTDESAEPEVIDLTGDDSVVQWEQNQQHPVVSSAADNSVVLLTSDDEEEPRDNDGSPLSSTRPAVTVTSPIWIEENSQNRRKRRGGAVNSRQASKRSRLLASSAGEASAAEPIDLEESRVLSFDLAVDEIIDLTDESAEPEVIDLTGDDSVVQWEQNQQHPVVSSAADNSVVLLTSDDEEEPRDNDGSLLSNTRPAVTVTSPIWVDDYSEWEQNQEHPLVSSAANNSVVPLVNDDEEEPRDNDGPSATLTNVLYQDCFLGQWEQNQQHPAGNPVVSSAADNSVVLLTSDDEEEPRDNDGTRPAAPVTSPVQIEENSQWEQNQEHPLVSSAADNSVVPLVNDDEEEPRDNDGPSATLTNVLYQDCFLGQWEQNQQHPAGNPVVSSAADNSVVLLTSDDEEEPRDNDGTRPAAPVTSPTWIDDYSELLEGYEQQRRNLTPRSQQLLDSPVLRSYDEYETADDVTDVESEVTDVESEVTDVESEVTDVESEVTDVESEVTDVESEVTDVESEVTDVESEVTDVESEVTDVESEVTDVESEVIDIEYGAADMEYGAADIQYEAAYVEPEVRRSLDEELAISEEWQRAVRCPICMDFFSQIIRSVRQVVSTQCGHLFCSRCIAVALENSRACPTCRTELPPRDYHPVYF